MNSGKLNSWRKNKQKGKTTNPQLWDPSGKKFETPRCKKITWKQDFETYQKYSWDFKMKPKFSETNIFLTYRSIPLWRLSFIRGLNFGGVGGGDFWEVCVEVCHQRHKPCFLLQTCQPQRKIWKSYKKLWDSSFIDRNSRWPQLQLQIFFITSHPTHSNCVDTIFIRISV